MILAKIRKKGFKPFQSILFLSLLAACLPFLGASAADKNALPSFAVEQLPAGDAPFHIQTGDFDRDGDLDIAVANRDSNSVLLYFLAKGGQGKLAAKRWAYKTGETPVALFAGDLDGDGDTDFVTANLGEKSFTILSNEGKLAKFDVPDIRLGKRYPLAETPQAVWGADFDRDGDIDLAVVGETFEKGKLHSRLLVFENNGKGEFKLKAAYPVGTEARMLAGGDLDGDGAVDLITTNKGARSVSLLFNDGKGSFASATALEAGDSPHGLWIGDLDRDGDLDIAVTNISANAVNILINRGKRRFAPRAEFQVGAQFPFALVGADIDRDGDVDLVTANLVDDNISLLLQQRDGTFSFAKSYPVGNGPRAIAAGDFDGDGLIDLVVVNRFADEAVLLLQKP